MTASKETQSVGSTDPQARKIVSPPTASICSCATSSLTGSSGLQTCR